MLPAQAKRRLGIRTGIILNEAMLGQKVFWPFFAVCALGPASVFPLKSRIRSFRRLESGYL